LEHAVPYVLHLERGRGALLYFGAGHLTAPDDPRVDQMLAAWEQFRPTIVLYEGPRRDAPIGMRTAIPSQGEGAVVRWLARRDRIPAASLDPAVSTQVTRMVELGYSVDDLALWYCLRQVVHERARHTGGELDARMLKVFDYYRHVSGLPRVPTTVTEFQDRVRARFPELGDWRAVPSTWADPAGELTGWSHTVSRRINEVRDRYMLERILGARRRGERVFAVAGATHVVMQEPALR
jgi:hypothetical protein